MTLGDHAPRGTRRVVHCSDMGSHFGRGTWLFGDPTTRFSHCAPFAPVKPTRFRRLADGAIVCWMTSSGRLCASWSVDEGG